MNEGNNQGKDIDFNFSDGVLIKLRSNRFTTNVHPLEYMFLQKIFPEFPVIHKNFLSSDPSTYILIDQLKNYKSSWIDLFLECDLTMYERDNFVPGPAFYPIPGKGEELLSTIGSRKLTNSFNSQFVLWVKDRILSVLEKYIVTAEFSQVHSIFSRMQKGLEREAQYLALLDNTLHIHQVMPDGQKFSSLNLHLPTAQFYELLGTYYMLLELEPDKPNKSEYKLSINGSQGYDLLILNQNKAARIIYGEIKSYEQGAMKRNNYPHLNQINLGQYKDRMVFSLSIEDDIVKIKNKFDKLLSITSHLSSAEDQMILLDRLLQLSNKHLLENLEYLSKVYPDMTYRLKYIARNSRHSFFRLFSIVENNLILVNMKISEMEDILAKKDMTFTERIQRYFREDPYFANGFVNRMKSLGLPRSKKGALAVLKGLVGAFPGGLINRKEELSRIEELRLVVRTLKILCKHPVYTNEGEKSTTINQRFFYEGQEFLFNARVSYDLASSKTHKDVSIRRQIAEQKFEPLAVGKKLSEIWKTQVYNIKNEQVNIILESTNPISQMEAFLRFEDIMLGRSEYQDLVFIYFHRGDIESVYRRISTGGRSIVMRSGFFGEYDGRGGDSKTIKKKIQWEKVPSIYDLFAEKPDLIGLIEGVFMENKYHPGAVSKVRKILYKEQGTFRGMMNSAHYRVHRRNSETYIELVQSFRNQMKKVHKVILNAGSDTITTHMGKHILTLIRHIDQRSEFNFYELKVIILKFMRTDLIKIYAEKFRPALIDT